jgi:hypothetical protein
MASTALVALTSTAVREFRRRAWLRQYRASIKDPFTN